MGLETEQHMDVPRRQRTLGKLHMALSLASPGYFPSLFLSAMIDEGNECSIGIFFF
jgi:hypothetical protein